MDSSCNTHHFGCHPKIIKAVTGLAGPRLKAQSSHSGRLLKFVNVGRVARNTCRHSLYVMFHNPIPHCMETRQPNLARRVALTLIAVLL